VTQSKAGSAKRHTHSEYLGRLGARATVGVAGLARRMVQKRARGFFARPLEVRVGSCARQIGG
jgi:hypothetical protein